MEGFSGRARRLVALSAFAGSTGAAGFVWAGSPT